MGSLTRADERMYSLVRMVLHAGVTYSLEDIIARLAGIEDDDWYIEETVARMIADGYLVANRYGYRLTKKAVRMFK